MLKVISNLWTKGRGSKNPVLSGAAQIKAWRRAARMAEWSLSPDRPIPEPPGALGPERRGQGWLGPFLFHGFGDNGEGGSDPVLSGKLAWTLLSRRHSKTWRCEYANFDRPADMRLRPEAPARPQGFYWAFLHRGEEFKTKTINQFRKNLAPPETGLAAEGLQLLAVTHPHLADLMDREEFPFIALADYDVAPHGFNDFCESPQLFKSLGVVGMGVANVDGVYPRFAIPRLLPVGWGG